LKEGRLGGGGEEEEEEEREDERARGRGARGRHYLQVIPYGVMMRQPPAL
jgi:hypothetical protein